MANSILLGGQGGIGPHLDGCFCTTCRDRKVNALLSRRNVSLEMLHRVYVTSLTRSQEELLDVQFEFTKEEIIIGYCYKIKCLQGTGYTNLGSWCKLAHLKRVITVHDQVQLIYIFTLFT